MKKVYQSDKHKKFNLHRAIDRAERRLAHNQYRRSKNQNSAMRTDRSAVVPYERRATSTKGAESRYSYVEAPESFSLIHNTPEVISFIETLRCNLSERKETWVVLRKVQHLTYDAIVVLLSIMCEFRSQGVFFNGDFPERKGLMDILKRSGFLRKLFMSDTKGLVEGKGDGIYTHAWKSVDSELGGQVIAEATQTVWGERRRCQGVQRALIELMHNTNNHAQIDAEGKKDWWLSVQHLKNEKKVCFSFVDYGVGVFVSLDNKRSESKFFNWREKLGKILSFQTNMDLLQLILEGKVHETVTNEHFRGKGLPGIKDAHNRNSFSALTIITNDVLARVSEDEYIKLNVGFPGTFVYWELTEDNRSSICQEC